MCLVLPFGQTTMPTYFFQGVHFVSLFFVITYCELLYYLLSWCPFWPFLVSQPAISHGLDVNSLFSSIKVVHRLYFCARVCVCVCVWCAHGWVWIYTLHTVYVYSARAHCKLYRWVGRTGFILHLPNVQSTFTYNLKNSGHCFWNEFTTILIPTPLVLLELFCHHVMVDYEPCVITLVNKWFDYTLSIRTTSSFFLLYWTDQDAV